MSRVLVVDYEGRFKSACSFHDLKESGAVRFDTALSVEHLNCENIHTVFYHENNPKFFKVFEPLDSNSDKPKEVQDCCTGEWYESQDGQKELSDRLRAAVAEKSGVWICFTGAGRLTIVTRDRQHIIVECGLSQVTRYLEKHKEALISGDRSQVVQSVLEYFAERRLCQDLLPLDIICQGVTLAGRNIPECEDAISSDLKARWTRCKDDMSLRTEYPELSIGQASEICDILRLKDQSGAIVRMLKEPSIGESEILSMASTVHEEYCKVVEVLCAAQ